MTISLVQQNTTIKQKNNNYDTSKKEDIVKKTLHITSPNNYKFRRY